VDLVSQLQAASSGARPAAAPSESIVAQRSEERVLSALNEPMTISSISERTGLSVAGTWRVVQRLRKKDLVTIARVERVAKTTASFWKRKEARTNHKELQ
jgi:DNA-binding transcriptional regulator LsrR (DeoR family)